MSSQIPFTPLTSEALSKLTPSERDAFTMALQQVAAEQKPSMMTIAGLVEMIHRLITEPPAVRDYRVLVDYDDGDISMLGPCAEAIGCLFHRDYDGEQGVTLGALIDAAREHEGEQGERAHARVAELAAEMDAAAKEHNADA